MKMYELVISATNKCSTCTRLSEQCRNAVPIISKYEALIKQLQCQSNLMIKAIRIFEQRDLFFRSRPAASGKRVASAVA